MFNQKRTQVFNLLPMEINFYVMPEIYKCQEILEKIEKFNES